MKSALLLLPFGYIICYNIPEPKPNANRRGDGSVEEISHKSRSTKEDLTGQQFGRLTVMYRVPTVKARQVAESEIFNEFHRQLETAEKERTDSKTEIAACSKKKDSGQEPRKDEFGARCSDPMSASSPA